MDETPESETESWIGNCPECHTPYRTHPPEDRAKPLRLACSRPGCSGEVKMTPIGGFPLLAKSIGHRIEGVTGDFDMGTGKMVCVKRKKHGTVELCFAAGWNIPFAKIRLYTRDLARDADAVFDDAARLGDEIVRRWNAQGEAMRASPGLLAGWPPPCPHCGAGLLTSEDRGLHCDGCDDLTAEDIEGILARFSGENAELRDRSGSGTPPQNQTP